MIIHATFDIEFQKEALQHLKAHLPSISNGGQKYALLTDKVLIAQGNNSSTEPNMK